MSGSRYRMAIHRRVVAAQLAMGESERRHHAKFAGTNPSRRSCCKLIREVQTMKEGVDTGLIVTLSAEASRPIPSF